MQVEGRFDWVEGWVASLMPGLSESDASALVKTIIASAGPVTEIPSFQQIIDKRNALLHAEHLRRKLTPNVPDEPFEPRRVRWQR